MKKLLVSLAGLFVVLVAAVLVGPSLVDWNSQKSRLTDEVERATGRQLTIEGEMSLALLPAPALSASSVRFQNVENGSAPSMVELEELKVRVALWPLLSGQVQFESVVLVRPRILLEILPDGRRNWQFSEDLQAQGDARDQSAEGSPDAAGGAESSALSAAVRFDSFSIEDGSLIYRDGRSGQEERFEAVNGNIIAESVNGPFAVTGSAAAQGIATEFEVTLGKLVEAGATRFKTAIRLPQSGASAEVAGTVSLHSDAVALRGKVEASGENLAALLATGRGNSGGQLPALLANAFEVSGQVSADLEQLQVSDLSLILGEASLNGEVTAQLLSPLQVKAKLQTTKLDLDSLLAQAAPMPEDAAVPAETEAAAGAVTDTGRAQGAEGTAAAGLPRDVDAELALSVDAIVYRGQVIRQARFEGRLFEGRAEVRKAIALLPGGSDVTLSGSLEDGSAGLGFAGHLEAASDNVRAVLTWLGADVSGVPQDRLRRFALSGDIQAGTEQVTVQNLDMKLDLSRVLGGVVVALRERPGMGIGLSIDRLDLDAYLGGAGSGGLGSGQAGAAANAQPDASDDAGDAGGAVAAPSGGLLDSFDANIDVRFGSLTVQETTAKTVRLNGTLQAGALTFKDASVGDFGGNSGRYSGTLTGLGQAPSLEGQLELRIAKPLRLAKLANLDPKLFETVGPFNLNGNIKASLAEVAFNARAAALGGQFALDGTVQPLAAPVSFNVMVDADHDNLAKLVNRLSGKQLLGSGLGGLDAKARVAGTPSAFTVKDLSGTVGPSRLSGSLAASQSNGRLNIASIDMSVAAKHANVASLLGALALGSPVSPALGGLDLAAKVSGTAADLRVSDLNGRVGPIALKGSLVANLAAAPSLSAVDLAVGVKHANLAELLTALSVSAPPVSPAFGGIDLSGKVSGNQSDLRLSDLSGQVGPIALAGSLAGNFAGTVPAISSINLNLDVRHPNLDKLTRAIGRPGTVSPSFGGIDVRGHVVGTPEQIEIKDLNGKIGPGDVRGSVAADLRGAKPEIKIDLDTGPLPIAALLASTERAGGATGGGVGGSLSPRWSTRPLDLSALRTVNADVNLKSTALLYEKYRLDGAVVRAVLRDGLLDVRQFSGTLYDGAIQVAGKIAAGNQLDVGLSINAIEVQIGQLLRQQAGQDRVSGPVTVNANLTSRGASEAELISRLNGQGSVAGLLTIQAKAEEAVGAALLGLLGTKVKEVRGLANTSNTLLNAFAGSPAPLKGTFTVSNGQVRTSDTRLDGRDAFALTNGVADLPSWQTQSRTDVYQNENTQEPYLTAHLTGPIDQPNPRIEGGLLKRREPSQQAPAGGPQPSGSQQPQQQEPIKDLKDLKPKDILKDLLKGLSQ